MVCHLALRSHNWPGTQNERWKSRKSLIKPGKPQNLGLLSHMNRIRLEAVTFKANILHPWELFIACLNRFPLNSPFIRFITSQRAGALMDDTVVLDYTGIEKPVTARSRLNHQSGWSQRRACCSFHGCVQSGTKTHWCLAEASFSGVLHSLRLWGRCCVGDPDLWPLRGRE